MLRKTGRSVVKIKTDSTNREYKNSLFISLFETIKELLSLYNALTGSELSSETFVKIVTLTNILFTKSRNDIAFVLGDKIVVLIEHQSTICQNMPLRLLIYLARVYEKIIDNDAVYKNKLLKIPKPDFIVLYNGADPFPDEKVMKLSDAFMEHPEGAQAAELEGSLELKVRVININVGRNESMVNKCETLKGYVHFIGKVRLNLEAGLDLTDAATKAVKDCIKEGILAEYLKAHASEVINMLTTEFELERARKVWEEEAREEGIAIGEERGIAIGEEKGREEGREESIRETVQEMKKENFPDEVIARITKLSMEKIREYIK